MHRVVHVGANRAVPLQQFLDMTGHGAVQRIRGHRPCLLVGGTTRGQHPGQLGTVPGRQRTGIEQPVSQPVEKRGICAVGQLELPLAPLHLVAAFGAGRDPVVAELGDRRPVVAIEHLDGPGRADARHRGQRTVAHDGEHHVPQRVRHGLALQGHPDFGAGVGARRQFEVPPGIRSAGPPTQCDLVSGQVTARCVEVDSVQRL